MLGVRFSPRKSINALKCSHFYSTRPLNFHSVKPALWTLRKMTFILWECDLQWVNVLLCEQIAKKELSLVIKATFLLWIQKTDFTMELNHQGDHWAAAPAKKQRLDCISSAQFCTLFLLKPICTESPHSIQDSPCTKCTALCFPDVLIHKATLLTQNGNLISTHPDQCPEQ